MWVDSTLKQDIYVVLSHKDNTSDQCYAITRVKLQEATKVAASFAEVTYF